MAFSISKYPSLFHRTCHHLGELHTKHVSSQTQGKLLLSSCNCNHLAVHQKKPAPISVQQKLLLSPTFTSHLYKPIITKKDNLVVPFDEYDELHTTLNFKDPRREIPLLSTRKIHPATNNIINRFSHREREKEKRPVPRIYYIQNPFYWLDNKISFRYLKRLWDPEFNEWDFRKGANQAVSKVTNLMATDNYLDLRGLVSETEARYLRRLFASKIYSKRIRYLGVDPDDIQVSLPRKVNLSKHFDQKFCDIDMVYVAEKWAELGRSDALVLLVMLVRFHREFTEGVVPSWIITLFRVTKFKMYPSDQSVNRY